MKNTALRLATPIAFLLTLPTAAAQTFGPDFAGDYEFVDLGQAPGLPTPFGAVLFKTGDPNTLLIAGEAAQPTGQIYELPLTRDAAGRITGFAGNATPVITTPHIDGGLQYGPGGVLLYNTYPNNEFCQILPGSTVADKVILLTPLGVQSSTGGLGLVPPGFPGAGGLKIQSYDGATSHSADLVLDSTGTGTFDLANLQLTAVFTSGIGPESLVYVQAGQPGFAVDSALLTEFGAGFVAAYDVDALGNPLPATRRDFLTLPNADGCTRDPVTGDYVFTQYSSSVTSDNRIDLVYQTPVMTPYCFGDGTGTPCPCGNTNNGSAGGCDWGDPAFPEGGILSGSGSNSMAAGNAYLHAAGIEDNFGIFFGANNAVNGGLGNPLNDGLRCAGGGLVRLTPPTAATGNQASLPLPLQALDTGAASGVTRRYQYWFRTPTGPCGQMANLTNGLEIVWLP